MHSNYFSFYVGVISLGLAGFGLIMSLLQYARKVRRKELGLREKDWKDSWIILSETMLIIFLTVIATSLDQNESVGLATVCIVAAFLIALAIVFLVRQAAKK